MGYYLAVSAFRGKTPSEVLHASREYVQEHGVRAELLATPADAMPGKDALAFGGTPWTVVLWPDHFNICDIPAAHALSRRLETLVSTIHVYDDNYWTHVLFESGAEIDRFCTIPTFFPTTEEEARRLAARWGGSASAVAARLGVQPEEIARYMQARKPDHQQSGKVHPADEFGLENFWVFTDFWRRCGIPFPANIQAFESALRIDRAFMHRLPTENEL